MRINRCTALVFLLLAAAAIRADGTIRYKAEFKLGAMVPASLLQQQGNAAASLNQPIESVVEIQGNKEYAKSSRMPVLIDFATHQVTLLDPTGKRYATADVKDYLADVTSAASASTSMPTIPPAAKALLQSLRATFSARKTGRTDSILGVSASESEWVFTLEMPASSLPLPGLAPDGPNQTITLAKIVAHAWIATPDAVAKNAALSELRSHGSSMKYLYNPDDLLKIFGDYPGVHDTFAELLTRYTNTPPTILKVDAQVYLPILVQLAPLMQSQGQKLPPGFDPTASLGEVTIDVTQISDAPIDPAVFAVPADYSSVPVAELLKATAKSAPAAPPSAPAIPPPPPPASSAPFNPTAPVSRSGSAFRGF